LIGPVSSPTKSVWFIAASTWRRFILCLRRTKESVQSRSSDAWRPSKSAKDSAFYSKRPRC
jgi:hypothetical protein